MSVFKKFPSPTTSDGIKLFPVSSCSVKYSVLTGQFKQNQEKFYSPTVLIFPFCSVTIVFLSAFSDLNFFVLT